MSKSERFSQQEFDELFNPENDSHQRGVGDEQLAEHMKVDRYGAFQLTDAVRPSLDLKVKPTEGFRYDVYVDEETGNKVPVMMAAVSREHLFPIFMQLIQRLGPVVDVVLESSHDQASGEHVDLYREHIDMPVLTSVLWDYEELLTNDGCTGIAVLNPNVPQEVQFEEHKLIIVYGSPLEQFEFLLDAQGVQENPDIKFITEAEHVHSTSERYSKDFFRLRTALGLDGIQDQIEDGEKYGEDGDFYGGDGSCGLL